MNTTPFYAFLHSTFRLQVRHHFEISHHVRTTSAGKQPAFLNSVSPPQSHISQDTDDAVVQGKEDYADKGLDAVEKKFGGKIGHGANDPAKMRSTNEKIVSRPVQTNTRIARNS